MDKLVQSSTKYWRELEKKLKENGVNYLTRVEAGSNTSTVNLRVVRGDEMGLKKAAP
jgi:hypothetical protein